MKFLIRYSGLLITIFLILGFALMQGVSDNHSAIELLGGVQDVYAQDSSGATTTDSAATNSASENETQFASFLQKAIQAIYLLMRPLLAVAGAALDNSLVYGDWFFLRPSLWSMRQIMRNFAFFALGAVFLFGVLYNLVKGGDAGEKRSLKKLIPKMLIASLLIQASRFMMAALIDLSTIGVFSVGALPLNILGNGATSELANVRFVKPEIHFSLDNTKNVNGADSTHSIMYSCNNMPSEENVGGEGSTTKKYFIPCRAEAGKSVKDGEEGTQNTWFDRKASLAGEWSEHTRFTADEIKQQISDDYCLLGSTIIERVPDTIIDLCGIESLKHGSGTGIGEGYISYMEEFDCTPLGNFINKANGMTGPMYSLYASIFRMGEIALTPNHKGIVEISLEFMIKIIIGLALIVPLLVLAIMLVIRAVILWGFIIFLPLLVLARVFEFGMGESLGDKAHRKSLLSLIFMPVLAVFAISISLVVLTLIGRHEDVCTSPGSCDILSTLGVMRNDTAGLTCNQTTGKRTGEGSDECNSGETSCGGLSKYCYNFMNITDICFSDSQRLFGNGMLNIMTRLTVNMFGIGLMWMAVFAVLKSTAIIGGIAGSISGFAQSALKNIPLVPVPGMGMNSISALQNTGSKIQQMPNKRAAEQTSDYFKRLDKSDAIKGSDNKVVQENYDKAYAALATNDGTAQSLATDNYTKGVGFNTNFNDKGVKKGYFKNLSAVAGSAGAIASLNEAFTNNDVYQTIQKKGHENFQAVNVKSDIGRSEAMKEYNEAMYTRASISGSGLYAGRSNNINDATQGAWYIDTHNGHADIIEVTNNATHDINVTDLNNIKDDKLKDLLKKDRSRFESLDTAKDTTGFDDIWKLRKGLDEGNIAWIDTTTSGKNKGYYSLDSKTFVAELPTGSDASKYRELDIIRDEAGALQLNKITQKL